MASGGRRAAPDDAGRNDAGHSSRTRCAEELSPTAFERSERDDVAWRGRRGRRAAGWPGRPGAINAESQEVEPRGGRAGARGRRGAAPGGGWSTRGQEAPRAEREGEPSTRCSEGAAGKYYGLRARRRQTLASDAHDVRPRLTGLGLALCAVLCSSMLFCCIASQSHNGYPKNHHEKHGIEHGY